MSTNKNTDLEMWNEIFTKIGFNDFELLEYNEGHRVNKGKKSGKIFNPYWKVKNINIQNDSFYVMFCEPDCLCYFSETDFDKIMKQNDKMPTWFVGRNGYVAARIGKRNLYMHQIIMNFYDLEDRKKSVDHINRNKLDNRKCNLRIVSQSVNNSNTGKRNRMKTAKPLPKGIEQSDLPKYVIYYSETVKKTGQFREWFNIEKHLNLQKIGKKRWSTSKSMNNYTITEKLDQAKKKINELNKLQ